MISGNMHIHSLKNVLTYAITDITTWGADKALMVGHVRTGAYLYIFKTFFFHGGNCNGVPLLLVDRQMALVRNYAIQSTGSRIVYMLTLDCLGN